MSLRWWHGWTTGSDCVGPLAIPPEVGVRLRELTAAAGVDEPTAIWVCATVLAHRLSPGTTLRARVACGRFEADTPTTTGWFDPSLNFRAMLRLAATPQGPRLSGELVDVTVVVRADLTGLCVETTAASAAAPDAHAWATSTLRLLTDLVHDPDRAVSDHRLVDAAERDQILRQARPRDTEPTGHRTMAGPFEDQVARTPDAVALIDEDGATLTYRELDDRANRLAHRLLAGGAGVGTRIGVCLERSIDLVVAIYGAVKTGAAYVPLDAELPDARLAVLLNDSRPSHVLTDATCRGRLPAGAYEVVDLSIGWEESVDPPANAPAAGTATSLLHLLYTSGTSGPPKGVATVTAAALANCAWMQRQYAFAEGDVAVLKTSPGFDVSIWEIFWPLYHGARVVICRPGRHRDPAHLAQLVEDHRVTLVFLVPTMLAPFLTKVVPERTDALRWVVSGGEPMAPWLRDVCHATLPASRLVNAFGPTEAGPVTDNVIPLGSTDPVVPVGHQAPNFSMIVLDEHLALVPIGGRGEVYLGGAVGLADGYWGSPGRTAERFVADPYGPPGSRIYRTGDLCRLRDDGRLEHLGRIDRQLKIRGRRIEPGEIESVLAADPSVAECAVVVPPDPPQRLLAFVVLAGSSDVEPLVAAARSALPEHLLPHRIVAVEAIPTTVNGKIDEAELIRTWQETTADDRVIEPPVDDVEATLIEIYSRFLTTTPIGALDRFAELGGHSLLAFDVLDACEAALHVKPDVTVLLTGSVRDVAGSIRRAQNGAGER